MNDEQPQVFADGWYRVTDDKGYADFEQVMNGHCDYGNGASVAECLSWGYTFEPAICMTQAEYDAAQQEVARLTQRVQELEVELQELEANMPSGTWREQGYYSGRL